MSVCAIMTKMFVCIQIQTALLCNNCYNYSPNFEHSIIVVVKVVGEGSGLDVQLTHKVCFVAVLEEVQLALIGIVDGKPRLPGLPQSTSGHSQQRYRAWQ